ncbi:titin homolog isoform X2 [Eriocheir sinensis]|uniref:titin homolog isoform X2 n=1 Tax=Eriocheir sinensis TaxID=95602 RepID=UPI0021C69B45|nr:titin homolog isoform X2 [Eriocheir sinensis]
MSSHGRIPFSTHSIGQGDLDFQPVREARVRVLNDIPKEPVVPPPPPQVKFNFVDVTFPKATQKNPTESPGIHHGSPSKKKRSSAGKERNARDQIRYDKENSNTGRAQRNMERDRREYLSRLLRRGMPVWEEVPVEERASRVIGKEIHAVWEDVKDGYKNSYPLEHNDDLIDTPRESLIEGREIDLKSRAEKLNHTLQKSSQVGPNTAYGTPYYYQSESPSSHELLHSERHTIPPEAYGRTHEPPAALSSELHYETEVSQGHPTQELIDGHVEDSSQIQEPLQNPSEHLLSQESVPHEQEVLSSREDGRQEDVMDQGRISRPVLKKIQSGRIDNDGTSSISWWPGDKLYKERDKNEEEEKHEKESTKEKKGKRDLSAPPSVTQKRRQVMADQEETEKVVKSPVRVRHYEPDEVRKYIRDKQSERTKAIKEQQRKQEQEKIQRSERMRELAIKTKQLSQSSKKGCHESTSAELSQKQNELEQQPIINWGAPKDWDPQDYAEATPTHHTRTQPKEQNLPFAVPLTPATDRAGKLPMQSETTRDPSHVVVVSPKKEKHGETYAKKKSRKESKKKKRQSVSDSEAISDIVSRTVEECERKVKSSSVSVESLSSLSSYSCSSSDAESRSSLSQSESLSSGLDLTPKERAVALGQLAQKLTSRVTQEAGSLSQRGKHKEDVPDVSQKMMSSNKAKQAKRGPHATGANILSDPRASLSLSQIETMSVEELIAKMTAMLPNKSVSERRSNPPQNDPQNKSINIYERLNLEHSDQTQNKTEDLTRRQSQDVPMRESLQRVLTEQLPNLVVPDVPKLKLSNAEKKLQESWEIAQEDLSTLPGHNIVKSVQDLKSLPDEGKQVYLKMTPSHKLQHAHLFPQSESHLAGKQHCQSQILRPHKNYVTTPRHKYVHAALVIQAAYRGYRVRKITNSLLNRQMLNKKNTSEVKYSKGPSNTTEVSVGPKNKKFFRNNDRVIEGGTETSQEVQSKTGKEQDRIWQKLQSKPAQRSFKPHEESYYVSQRSDLPEWIKPYFVLTETGDVKNFLETNINRPQTGMGAEAEKRGGSSMISQSPECASDVVIHPRLISEKSVHDVTLTEGPLSDIEMESIFCFDKETQTSYNKYLDTKDKKSEQGMQEFIDLKKLSKRKGQTIQGGSVEGHEAESYETSSRRALNSSQLGLSQKEHEATLEEGPLEEMLGEQTSLQLTENETLESGSTEPNVSIEEGPIFETSGILDTSNVSSSIAVEEASAPHELLGEGVHLGPASLRLRLNAELMYQDTLGKALNHLHSVKQLNILNRSRQEAMALSQSLALQQQKIEATTQRENENDLKIQEEKTKREDYEGRLKERLKQQEEALQKVEKIEKEARSRFAELEREVRSKAEQAIAQVAERVPQPNIAQSDVIAAAAVAAVGATISQWKQLRPARGHDSHGSITLSDGSLSPKISSDHIDASSSRPLSDKSHSKIYSARSLSREHRSTSEMPSSYVSERLDNSLSKSSVAEELPSAESANKTSEVPEVISDVKSSVNSVPENIESIESSIPALSVNESSVKSSGNGFKTINTVSISQGTSVSEKVDSGSSSKTKVSSGEVASASNLVSGDASSVENSGTVTEAISKDDSSGVTKSSEAETVSNALLQSPSQKSFSSKDHKKFQGNEIAPSKRTQGSPLKSSLKSKVKERKREERDASDIYSESFEVDSESEDSNSSQLQSQDQGTHGDLALVVSSGSILNDLGYKPSTHAGVGVSASMPGVGGEGALSVTVSVVESLLKEEEVHHQHQKTLLKLQEQSLVEEAKWKLATLQSEGGPGMRRRQRAIVLQLREQKAHLKRLRETQSIGAQQRRLMLLQLHHLLASTSSLSGYSSRGYLTAPRGHSPNPASPRLTPRLMEMLSSSSSDAPDDVTFSLLMRGRDSDSSSPSEGGGREKRRCHSEDRLKISSGRHHEKRRTAEIEALQQQILQEDKEILRLKSKSPYDIHDKDSVKPKRKGDFISKRSRDKKEKCSGSVSPLSVLVHGSKTLVDNSVPAENVPGATHDSQSSLPEEGGSETVSHSDAASSVSEQEGLSSTSHRTGSSKSKEVSHSKRVPSYAVSERETREARTSKPKMISREFEPKDIQEEYSDSKVSEQSSSAKTISSEETERSIEERYNHDNSDRISKSLGELTPVESEVHDKSSKSQESSTRTKPSTSGSVKSTWSKPESVIPEDITDGSKTRTTNSSSRHSIDKRADSEERSSDSKSAEGKSSSQKSSARGLPLPLKVPLSPRSLHRQHRRYSSESDDSFTLSQTETASDISDGEGKLFALKEELAVRRAEAERLKKEKRRLRRERLASQERSLRQQISTYDAYIQHARMELEKESKELQQVSMVRPLIKKPQVAETKKSKLSESITSPEKSDVSDVSLVSESSKSDQSSMSRLQETSIKERGHAKPQESHLKKDQDMVSSSSGKDEETEEKLSSSKEVTVSEIAKSQREDESEKTSRSSSISESLNEESISEHLQDHSSKTSLSQESSAESDHTNSQASSTETIVHSPQKLDPSQKDEVGVSVSEVNAALLEVIKDNEKDRHASISKPGASDASTRVEGEKLEIFIPTSGFKFSEAEELAEGNTNTSAEQSICEEVFDDNFKETEIENSSQETSSHNLRHPVTTEDKIHEEAVESNSSVSENKEVSLKPEPALETNISANLSFEAKEISPETESKVHPPTLDRQKFVDDISNNMLAIMIKDTSQLFTNIVKDKVNLSKASEVLSHVEAAKESQVPELRGEASEPLDDAGLQGQASCSTVPEEKASSSKTSSSNKSQILQRVNELIGESVPASPRLTSLTSPRSGDVQLTFDLSPEASPSVSPTRAKATKVEEDREVEVSKAAPSLLPGERATASGEEEEEDDSLSPSHDVVKAEEYKLDTETLTTRLLNLASAPELDLEVRLSQLNEDTEFSVEGIEGDWFDDDFWTSSDNRKKQQQLKAEEERITAEIARLEELQHLQQKYPGLVIREVPNKPPPPYTPPQVTSPPSPGSSPAPARPPAYTNPPTSPVLPEAQPMSPTHSSSISHRLSKADQRKLAAHITQVVPITEEEALPIIDSALDTLYEAWQNSIDPGDIPPPPHTTLAKAFSLSSFNDEDMHEDEKTSSRAFHLLLFCLAREQLSVPYKLQHAPQPPPWMKQVLPQTRMLGMVHNKSRAGLFSHVREQVKVLFGWKPPLQKESLMIRWAQKHRDLVDQVLVKELQAEEASWTNYDEDEAAVKTKVASEILDTLLSETVSLVSSILVKKLGYIAH